MREAMIRGLTDRATDDTFDFDNELRALLAPLGLTPEDSGGSITVAKRLNADPRGARSSIRVDRRGDGAPPRRPPPAGHVSPAEQAVIVFARTSTWMQPITDEIWAALTAHFDTRQIVEISFTVGIDQLVGRFHAAIHTDVDDATVAATSACAVTIPPAPD